MERPIIKDSKVSAYVDELERQLSNFKSEKPIVKSYLTLKRYIEENNKMVDNIDFELSKLSDKDDKTIDRAIKYIDEIMSYNDKLQKMEKMVNPVVLEAETQEAGGILEQALKESK